MTLALAGLLLAPAVLQANVYTYTSTAGGSTDTDGAGNWDTTHANWRLNDSGNGVNWANNNDAIIGNGGTPGLISCGTAIVVGNVTFNAVASGLYTFNSGTIRVGGAGAHGNVSTFFLPSGVSADFGNNGGSGQALVQGSSGSGIAADGGGTLILSYTGTSTYSGPTTIQGGTKVLVGAGFVSSSSSALNLTSGTLGAFNSTARTWTKPVNLNGNFTLGAPSPRNGNLTFSTGAWTLSGGSWTLTVDTISAAINSSIGGSGLGLGFSSVNSGTLTLGLSGTEGYTGPTTINSGTLAVASGCNLNAASGVVIAAGGTFDVSAQTTWTAGGSASPAVTASGTGTPATIKGGTTVALGIRPITLNYDGADDTMLTVSQGALTMNGNTITINTNNTTTTLAHGLHNIIAVTGGSITLSATPLVTGTALAAGDSAVAVSTTGGMPNYVQIDVETTPVIPVLNATTKSAITNSTATLGATLVTNYSLAITDYGIVWGTSPNPTTANHKVQFGTTTPTLPSTFTVSATGLPAATTVYYSGYAVNSAGTGYSTNDSFLTLANEPATQASAVSINALQNGNLNIFWTRGSGSKSIVLVSASSPVDAPVDGTTYTANATFGSGTLIGASYVAYLGTGTNVTLAGLSTSTTYYVAVYELSGSGGSENYFTDSPATGSQTTVATPISTITWTGSADTDWNNTGNWDASLVPDVGTAVVIPSGTTFSPIYANPMVAASVAGLTDSEVLNINTNGFNCGAISMPVSSSQLLVNTGGVANVAGGISLLTGAVVSVTPGSSLTASGTLSLGSGSTAATAFGLATNFGGTLTVGGVSFNAGNASITSSARLVIAGGINSLGAVNIQRSPGGDNAPPALGTDGLIISNGLVKMTSIALGNNAHGIIYQVNGIVTNSGTFTLQNATAARPARFLQTGGLFVTTDPNVVVMAGTATTVYSVLGGTNIVGGFQFGSGTSAGTASLTNQSVIYVGSKGVTSNGLTTIAALLNTGGKFGASTDWTNAAPLTLNGGSLDCQDAAGTPHNIYSSGVLMGSGALTKTGNGTLTLNAANTYSGITVINAGKLAVGASGSLNSSSKIYVGSGATFDVSAVSGYTINNQTLTGLGVVTGAVAVASSVITAIDPGSNTLTGTLSFSNSVTETGGAINHFDLVGAPNPNNDLAVIAGDLNVSGTNAVDIGGSALVVGSVYPIIKYGGNFNGGISNFIVTSVVGTLTNDAVAKTISFIPQATLRGPTNIVWVGNAVNTNWDTEVSTNWLNAGALDFFVPKDTVQFTDVGASNTPVNIVGTVTPTSILVNSRSNYVFASTSGGGISDSTTPTSLTVTNTGTLTVLTTNTYTGTTTIDGGGALAVASVANIGSVSPVGKSDTLVINNGTFIYSGPNASTDRGATLGNSVSAINVSANGSLTLNGTLSGAGGLTKTGNGNLILPNGNGFTGGTFVNAGTLTMNSAGAVGGGTITLNGGTLAISAIKPANTINVAANSTIVGGNSGGLTGIKNVTGSANLLLAVTASSGVFDLLGDMSAYSGTITCSNAGGGTVRLNGSNGSKLATWDLGTGTMELDTRASTSICYFGALTGGASASLVGHNASDTLTAVTYDIGDNGLSTTFQGAIKDGLRAGQVLSIVKTGTGTLTLSGASTYTGATTVSNGTLAVNGSLATASVVTVKGGTLAGGGIIGGATTLNAGAILSAGSNSVGTLTFSGNLTLDAASTNSFAVTTAGGASNSVTVAGTLSPNSSVIKITSGTALAVGTYTLFNYAGVSGSFNATPVFDVAPAATASIVDTGSQIQLVIGTSAGPTISSITTSGADLTLNATGGTAGGSVSVLTSTDLTVPLASWTTVTTGNYDGSGNFSYTVSGALSSGPQQFYILKQ